MRTINLIVIHCSATPPDMDIGADTIRSWHVDDNGWNDIGYHQVIRRNGVVEEGRPESVAGAHAAGVNANSLGFCLIGGVDRHGKAEANFTQDQYKALFALVDYYKKKYPNAKIIGHNEISEKDCPSFNVKAMFGG